MAARGAARGSSPSALAAAAGAAARVTGQSLSLPPSNSVHAPGSGVHARIWRSIRWAGSFQSTRASAGVSFGAKLIPSAGCGTARTVPSSMASRVSTSSRAPETASLPSRSPLVSAAPIGSVSVPKTGPASSSRTIRKVLAPGDVVAAQDRVLHRGGAAPRGQHGEVQVHPAVGRNVERGLREQRTVGGHRTAVGRDVAQLVEEPPLVRADGFERLDAELFRELGHRRPFHSPAAADGGVGPRDDRRHRVPGTRRAPAAWAGRPPECPRRPAALWLPLRKSAGWSAARPGLPAPAGRTTRPRGWPSWPACAAGSRAGR